MSAGDYILVQVLVQVQVRVQVVLDTHLDGADVLLAEALERLDDLLVRAPQLEHNATRTLLLQPHITHTYTRTHYDQSVVPAVTGSQRVSDWSLGHREQFERRILHKKNIGYTLCALSLPIQTRRPLCVSFNKLINRIKVESFRIARGSG